MSMHCVNCWDSLKSAHHNVAGNGKRDGSKSAWMNQWEISSQASERSVEGSTNRSWSLSETVKAQECAAPPVGEDIFWSAGKPAVADHKQVGHQQDAQANWLPIKRMSCLHFVRGFSLMALTDVICTCKRFRSSTSRSPWVDCRPGREQSLFENRVNCWNPLTVTPRAISSQASSQEVEGSTTRSRSLGCSEMVKTHECAAPLAGDDIVWTASRDAEVEGKLLGGNKGLGQAPVCSSLLVPSCRRRNQWSRLDSVRSQQRRSESTEHPQWGPRVEMRKCNRVNSGKPTATVAKAIPSQAARRRAEGVETRSWSLGASEMVKTQERAAPSSIREGEDIVRYSSESRRDRINSDRQQKQARTTNHHSRSTEHFCQRGILLNRIDQRVGHFEQRSYGRSTLHHVHDRRSTFLKAVAKSTSNGETLHGQSRAELLGNKQEGVETCAYSNRVMARKKHGAELGVEPSLLNGGHESLAIREGIVRSWEQSQTHLLQTRDVQ